MELFDLTKQAVNNLLPKKHQAVLASLVAGLLVVAVAVEIRQSRQTFVHRPAEVAPADLPQIYVEVRPLEVTPDTRVFLEVKSGDNLSTLFTKAGLSAQHVLAITNSTTDTKALTDLRPGNNLAFDISDEGKLLSFEVIKSPLESLSFQRNAEGKYDYEHILREPTVSPVYKEAVITDSLFLAANRSKVPVKYALELAGIFGGVVDFIQDTREGDSFSLIYEERFLDDQFVGTGRILAAQFVNQGKVHRAVRYESADGSSNFYSPDGESMRKAFLLNPVEFTRISSGFTTARRHPILNTIRAHKGTDYAAPKGTQVVATADGKVTFVGRSGSFGKLIVIQHGDRVVTKYAHLNDYAKGLRVGTQVRQNDVIGYVGATGSATGPHLHYEFLLDGVHRNSQTILDQLPRAQSIADSELPRFRAQTAALLAMLDERGKQSVAFVHDLGGNREE
jgi:murein DD-endopeptidase MepM/ murein hydrolase activator NlpD